MGNIEFHIQLKWLGGSWGNEERFDLNLIPPNSLSHFGEKVMSIGEDRVREEINLSEWKEEYGEDLDDDYVYLGTIILNDRKEVVDEKYYKKPNSGEEVRDKLLF